MDRSVMASLRFKLTFYYLAILSLVLVGFGIVLYAYLSRTLMTTIDSSLAAQIEQIERRVAFAAGGEAAAAGGGTGEEIGAGGGGEASGGADAGIAICA